MGQLISLITGEQQQKQEDTKKTDKTVPVISNSRKETENKKPAEITDIMVAYELNKYVPATQPPDMQSQDTQPPEQQVVKKYLKYKAKYLAMKINNN
jgi:hypothetical protein